MNHYFANLILQIYADVFSDCLAIRGRPIADYSVNYMTAAPVLSGDSVYRFNIYRQFKFNSVLRQPYFSQINSDTFYISLWFKRQQTLASGQPACQP